MAGSMKKNLVQVTYGLLKSEGIENIKIRRIAAEAGCTSTVIYKHFEDLDHLLSFASIWILKDYFKDFQQISSDPTQNVLDTNLRLWERFAYYAFNDIQIFELLFWGKYKERLGDMIYEYYQLFREDMKDFDGLAASVLFNDDLREREYIMLRRAAATGCLALDDIAMLSDLASCLFHGMLLEYKDKYKEPGRAQEGAQRFMDILTSVMDRYRLN